MEGNGNIKDSDNCDNSTISDNDKDNIRDNDNTNECILNMTLISLISFIW